MKRGRCRPEKKASRKDNTYVSNYAKGAVVTKNFVMQYSGRNLVSGDIRDDASLLRVVTPPITEIA
jgi:hypothetical protein